MELPGYCFCTTARGLYRRLLVDLVAVFPGFVSEARCERCTCDHHVVPVPMHYILFSFTPKQAALCPAHDGTLATAPVRSAPNATSAVICSKQTHAEKRKSVDLLFLHDIFFDGAELLQSAGNQVPLVLLFQARVFLAQLVHLVLEFLNATLLLLQQLLLGLDDIVELLQVLGRLAGVFRRVLHVAVRETPVHGDRFVAAAARSRTGSVPIRRRHRGALSSRGHC